MFQAVERPKKKKPKDFENGEIFLYRDQLIYLIEYLPSYTQFEVEIANKLQLMLDSLEAKEKPLVLTVLDADWIGDG